MELTQKKKLSLQGSPKRRDPELYTQDQFKELQENQKAKADVYKVKLRKRSPQKYYPDLSLEALYSTFSKNKYRGNKSMIRKIPLTTSLREPSAQKSREQSRELFGPTGVD